MSMESSSQNLKGPAVPEATASGGGPDRPEWLFRGQTITDGDGLVWKFRITHSQRAAEHDPEKLIWVVTCDLFCEECADQFVRTKTLNKDEDSRLIALLECFDDPVRIYLRPLVVEAFSEEQAIRKTRLVLREYLNKVRGRSLHQIKRNMICQMIDKKCGFTLKSEVITRSKRAPASAV